MNKPLKRLLQMMVLGGVGYGLYLVQAPLSKAGWSEMVCGMSARHVTVRVGPRCEVTDKATLDVAMSWLPHQRMVWTLAPTGGARWKFAPGNGVELIGTDIDPTQVVFYARQRESDRVFRWCNANSASATFEYQINLVGPSGATCVVDPLIYNH
jgi:hypothetical protein